MPRYNEILTEEFLDDISMKPIDLIPMTHSDTEVENTPINIIGLSFYDAIDKLIKFSIYDPATFLLCLLNSSSNNVKFALHIAKKEFANMPISDNRERMLRFIVFLEYHLATDLNNLSMFVLHEAMPNPKEISSGMLDNAFLAFWGFWADKDADSVAWHSYDTAKSAFSRINKEDIVDCLNYALQLYKEQ